MAAASAVLAELDIRFPIMVNYIFHEEQDFSKVSFSILRNDEKQEEISYNINTLRNEGIWDRKGWRPPQMPSVFHRIIDVNFWIIGAFNDFITDQRPQMVTDYTKRLTELAQNANWRFLAHGCTAYEVSIVYATRKKGFMVERVMQPQSDTK